MSNIAVQDEVKRTIAEFYAEQSCDCREVDRRADPRFGYRAVHLIVRIDGIPVEIQIRTGLQDTWAQIVERLADRWGRGIRYGQEPELPDSLVRSDDFVVSRCEAMSTLMSLGDAIAATERAQQGVNLSKSMLGQLDSNIQANLRSQVDPEAFAEKIPTGLDDYRQKVVAILAKRSGDLDDEGLALLSAGVDKHHLGGVHADDRDFFCSYRKGNRCEVR